MSEVDLKVQHSGAQNEVGNYRHFYVPLLYLSGYVATVEPRLTDTPDSGYSHYNGQF